MIPSDAKSRLSPRHARLSCSIAAVLAVAAPGCASDPAGDGATGTLVLPLVQTGAHGELFHLSNATFDITGAEGAFEATVDGSGLEPSVSVSVPPGLVSVFLHDGWSLEKSLDGGVTFEPVSALLATFNPAGARVLANSPSTVEFDFIVRDINGELQIKLGVITEPRELAGGYIVQTATGDLAVYADPPNNRMDFGVFYDLFSMTSEVLPDGTKQHVYVANHLAAELYNDDRGILASQLKEDLVGGFLTYTVAARPDGTFEVSGELAGLSSDLVFGPSVIDDITSPTLDPDGFPKDEFFYDSELPFTHTLDTSVLTGLLRMRHLIPGQPGPRQ